MVGVILLVGLTVLAVAVAGVVLLSSSQPNEIPHATIVAGSKSGSFALVHEGATRSGRGSTVSISTAGAGLRMKPGILPGQLMGSGRSGESSTIRTRTMQTLLA